MRVYILTVFCFLSVLQAENNADRVLAEVRTYFASALKVDSEQIDLQVGRIPDLVNSLETHQKLVIRSQRKQIRLGRQTVWLELYNGQILKDKAPLSVDIALHIPVWVSTEKISRHEQITAGRVKKEIRRIDRQLDQLADKVLGLETSRMIRENMVLLKKHLRVAPLVKTGDAVAIKYESARLIITTEGIAREEGMKGEQIVVQCETTGKRLKGTVVSSSLVVIE